MTSAPATSRRLSRGPEVAALRCKAGVEEWHARLDAFMAEYLGRQRADYLCHPVFSSLYEDLGEFVCRPGKRLRPLLFLLGYRLFAAEADGAPAVDEEALLMVGTSLEFLHAFILIHDDIIDRSDLRRRRPALHRVMEGRLSTFSDRRRVGSNLALVLGDILFALAQKCLIDAELDAAIRLRLSSLLLGCMIETGFGEAADIVHGTRDVSKVSVAEIEEMYLLKTVRYTIECPLAMASLLAGGGEDELDALAHAVRPAGLAFQIQNDLNEFARFEVSDAEVPADILEGKKTLLIRTAFSRLDQTDRSLLQLCLNAGAPTEASVSKARELIARSGAVCHLAESMQALFAEAESRVSRSLFRPSVQAGLTGLIRMVRGAADQP